MASWAGLEMESDDFRCVGHDLDGAPRQAVRDAVACSVEVEETVVWRPCAAAAAGSTCTPTSTASSRYFRTELRDRRSSRAVRFAVQPRRFKARTCSTTSE